MAGVFLQLRGKLSELEMIMVLLDAEYFILYADKLGARKYHCVHSHLNHIAVLATT